MKRKRRGAPATSEDWRSDGRAVFQSAERFQSAVAELGSGGPVEFHAFLRRWGTSTEIKAKVDAQTRIWKWWLDANRGDTKTLDQIAGIIERLTALYWTARRAQKELLALGWRYNPKRGYLVTAAKGKRRPVTLYATLISETGTALGFVTKGRYSEKALEQIRGRLRYVIPPNELTDTKIRRAVQYRAKKPAKPTQRKTRAR